MFVYRAPRRPPPAPPLLGLLTDRLCSPDTPMASSASGRLPVAPTKYCQHLFMVPVSICWFHFFTWLQQQPRHSFNFRSLSLCFVFLYTSILLSLCGSAAAFGYVGRRHACTYQCCCYSAQHHNKEGERRI